MQKKILLTGASGFLGRHTIGILESHYGNENVVGVSSQDYNLMDVSSVEEMVLNIKPDVIVHFAAYSGGIGANKEFPADFYYKNTILTAHMFDVVSRLGVKKLVYPMGGCSYPASAKSPIDEEQLWNGYPQAESAGYSTAKMMGVVAAKSYRSQYDLNATVLIPGNMYGEYDNFSRSDSHVVPAMVRRFYEAQLSGTDTVVMWGSGRPTRDFVYAGDVARLIPHFIDNYDEVGPVNISSGRRTSIRELAETIKEHVGFEGKIEWDLSKPDGQMDKIFSTEKLAGLGLSCDTSLDEGLRKTIKWFLLNYKNKSDGLRL